MEDTRAWTTPSHLRHAAAESRIRQNEDFIINFVCIIVPQQCEMCVRHESLYLVHIFLLGKKIIVGLYSMHWSFEYALSTPLRPEQQLHAKRTFRKDYNFQIIFAIRRILFRSIFSNTIKLSWKPISNHQMFWKAAEKQVENYLIY
jgi:hypothetical protein